MPNATTRIGHGWLQFSAASHAWNMFSSFQPHPITQDLAPTASASFSSDSRRLAVASKDLFSIWDVETGTPIVQDLKGPSGMREAEKL